MSASSPLAVCAAGGRLAALADELPADARVLAGADDVASALRAARDLAPAHDILVVTGDVQPAPGWCARLRGASAGDPTIASVSAGAGEPDAAGHASPLPGPEGPLVLVRAPALALAGLDSGGFDSAAGLLADFGERSTARGFVHVRAGGVLLAGAAEAPATARIGVTLDVRALGSLHGGTQVHALELVAALARTGRVRLRAVVPPDLDPLAASVLDRLGVETLPYAEAATSSPAPTDLVHRPNQISTIDDLRLLLPLGRRVVVTQQDLLTYRIPDYSGSPDDWAAHRAATQEALGAADHVVFFSAYVRAQALAEELVVADRATVVPIGTDHREIGAPSARERPPALGSPEPFVLCLGSDLRHKNRVFALALLAELDGLGWPGRLVLAGPHVPHGSSQQEERAWLDGSDLRGRVLELGPVSPAEREWLLHEAAAVVYPSVTEGFGLLPFEAARAGVPCLFAPQGSLAELLPERVAALVAWDASASAARALPLLSAGPERAEHVGTLQEVAGPLTWDACAQALVEVYERTLAGPAWPAAMLSRKLRRTELAGARLEQMLHEEGARHGALVDALGEWGLELVGPGGVVEMDDRETLTRFMYHRRLASAVLAAFQAGRSATRALRRR